MNVRTLVRLGPTTKQDEQVAAIQLHNYKEKSEVDKTVSSVSCVGQVATIITAPCINANDHGQRVTGDSLVWDPESDTATMINPIPTSDKKPMPSSCNQATKSVLKEINGLNMKDVRESIRIKPRIKRKGRPKGTSTLWPTKKRKLMVEVKGICKLSIGKRNLQKDSQVVNPKRMITRKAILKKFILRVLLHIVVLFDSRQKKLKSRQIL